MSGPIEAFLIRLQFRLEDELSPNRALAILSETEAHLRDRSAALEELGATHTEAERQAVEGFAQPDTYALSILEANGPSPKALLKPIVATATLATVAGGLTVLFTRSWHGGWVVVLPAMLLVSLGATSFRAARWHFGAITKVGLAASLATWAAMSILWVKHDMVAGYEVTWRKDGPSFVSSMRSNSAELKAIHDRYAAALSEFHQAKSDPLAVAGRYGLRKGDLIMVPYDRMLDENRGVFYGFPYDELPAGTAVHKWKQNGDQYLAATERSSQVFRTWANEYEQAPNGGYIGNFIRMWMWGAIFVPFTLVPLWLAHAIGAALGIYSRMARRWSRRRARLA